MTEKIYQYTLYAVLAITLGFSAFLISADNLSPFTTQATMHKTVANIAPEVSGVVATVDVTNGEFVHAGDTLFTLDNHRYALAVKQAEAELHQAEQSHSAKWQQLHAAEQALTQRMVEANNAHNQLLRQQALQAKGLITVQAFDDAKTAADVATSAVKAAKADIARLNAELATGNKNAAIELAEAKLASAKLDLARSHVVAKTDGTVSNLQLQAGTYVNQGAVVMFVVNETNTWLSADFNEKGVAHLQAGTPVWISFDALPGKVYQGTIANQDRAVFDANNPANQLSTVGNDSRWIREQQKIRTRITVDETNPALIAGSRASVMVENGNSLIDGIGYCWISLVSWFRYIY